MGRARRVFAAGAKFLARTGTWRERRWFCHKDAAREQTRHPTSRMIRFAPNITFCPRTTG